MASGPMKILMVGILATVPFNVIGESERAGGPYTVKLKRQSIPLHSDDGVVQHKSAYFGEVAVGGPTGQLFQVVFDTGSGHLVLPSMMCKSDTCTKHRRYKKKASLYATDVDADGSTVSPGQPRDQITVSFGTGQVTGIFVRDRVCLGHPDTIRETQPPIESIRGSSMLQVGSVTREELNELPVEDGDGADSTAPAAASPALPLAAPANDWRAAREHGCMELQFINAVKMTEDPFATFAFDGVMGLGLGALSQTLDFSFLHTASSTMTGAWEGRPEDFQRTFSIFLAVSEQEDSEITFGGYKSAHMDDGAQFAWTSVQEKEHGYWQIDIKAILIDGVELDFCSDGTCRAVVDTGTSLIAVPSTAGPMLVSKLRHTGSPGLGCSGVGPALQFDLGSITLKLEPKDIARPEVESDGGAVGGLQIGKRAVTDDMKMEESADVSSVMVDQAQKCVPMLMHLDMPQPLSPKTFILGEPVFQQYYTAFDMGPEKPRIGFALAKHVAPREALRIFT